MSQALSSSHQRVRRLRRLLRKRSTRWSERVYVAEGLELVRAALDGPAAVESLYVAAEAASTPEVEEVRQGAEAAGVRVHELAPGVLERVAGTVTPQPVLAVIAMPRPDPAVLGSSDLIAVCVELRDPGNAGTVLRCAEASGAGAVALAGACVDPFNPKAVRASAGAIFTVPVVTPVGVDEVLDRLGQAGVRRLGAVARGGLDYATVDWRPKSAVVLGNESRGLPDGVARHLDDLVTIPMRGGAESLNVGMSCAVLCFEALRQRRAGIGAASLVGGPS